MYVQEHIIAKLWKRSPVGWFLARSFLLQFKRALLSSISCCN